MKVSAGTLIKYNNKFLFCHPTNASWINSYGPAKGGIDDGEAFIDAAIRETKEEIGINISKEMISNSENPIEVIYYNKNKVIHKKVYLYTVNINSLSEIGLNEEIVPKEQLQLAEVDWAGFLSKTDMEEKCFHRFRSLIDLL